MCIRDRRGTLRTRLDTLTADHDALVAAHADDRSRLDALARDRDTLSADQHALRERHDALQTEHAAAQERLAAARTERDALEAQLRTLTDERDALHAANAEHETAAGDAQRRLDEAVRAREAAERIVATDRSAMAAATRERDALRDERDRLAHDLAALNSTWGDAQDTHDTLVSARDVAEAERDRLRVERNALAHDRDRLRTERDDLRAGRDVLTAERDDLAERLAAYSSAFVADDRATTHALIAERDALRTERDALRADLDTVEANATPLLHPASSPDVERLQALLARVQADHDDGLMRLRRLTEERLSLIHI